MTHTKTFRTPTLCLLCATALYHLPPPTAHAASFICTPSGTSVTNAYPDLPTTGSGRTGIITLWGGNVALGSYHTTGQTLTGAQLDQYKTIMVSRITSQRRWAIGFGPSEVITYEYVDYLNYDRSLGTNPAPGMTMRNAPDAPMTVEWATGGYTNALSITGRNLTGGTGFGWSIRSTNSLSVTRTSVESAGTDTIEMPLPPNEYQDLAIIYTGNQGHPLGISHNGEFSPGAWTGDRVITSSGGPLRVVCSRKATQLALTISTNEIDFGSISHGSTTPVTRELSWRANGIGQTPQWTMRFDNPATQSGAIMLGGGKVTITDGNGGNVAPNTDLNIAAGTSGKYTFELDPTDGQPGAHSTNVLITLTAN